MTRLVRRVLVVDDDHAIRGFLAEALLDEGFEVRAAASGTQALEAIRKGWRPDLILLDLMMPDMDGWAFRKAQRSLARGLSEVPVVVMSAARNLSQRVAEIEARAVFAKPFDLEALLATVNSLLVLKGEGRRTRSPTPFRGRAGTLNGVN